MHTTHASDASAAASTIVVVEVCPHCDLVEHHSCPACNATGLIPFRLDAGRA